MIMVLPIGVGSCHGGWWPYIELLYTVSTLCLASVRPLLVQFVEFDLERGLQCQQLYAVSFFIYPEFNPYTTFGK